LADKHSHSHHGDGPQSTTQVIEHIYAALNRGDLPSALALFDPRIEWREAEGNPLEITGQPWHGIDEITRKLFATMQADVSNFRVNAKKIRAFDDVVVMEGRYTGVHTRSKKTLDCQVCHIWTVRGGKAATFQQYTDTAQLQAFVRG
jgi:ketosteroid isomerase-like protein